MTMGTTTSTTLPDLTGWYAGTLYPGSVCLDDPGHTGYVAPPIDVTFHMVGFAPDATAHYEIGGCIGGWDTGAAADLSEPDDDPDCRGCNPRYSVSWPPAVCGGGGSWLMLGGSTAGISVTILEGLPWECHDSRSGTLLPIPPPN